MKALTFSRPGLVELRTKPQPTVTHPADIVVEVTLAAICGSDLHVYRGNEVGLDPGTTLGHELLGRVVAAGDEVDRVGTGDVVVSAFSTSCGSCFYCRRGITARCTTGQLLGWVQDGHGLDGAQAQFVRIPLADSTVAVVPESLGESAAALFAGDILSTAVFAATSGGVAAGDSVAILGCGPVGLMCVAAAREAGAATVWAIDSIDERLQLAARFGSTPLSLASNPTEEVRHATDGRGADVVLEAVGSREASRLACDLVRPGGVISAAGVHTESTFAFSPVEAYDKNLTYRAGRSSAYEFMPRAFEIAESGRYPLDEIVSHELSLAEGARGYEIFDAKLESCTKVLLRP